MTTLVSLDEKDITEAISMWLETKHKMKVKGAVQIEHTPGDPREPPITSVRVVAEPM